MWKHIKALFMHRPRLYKGSTDKFCRNVTTRGRRIRIWGIAIGPFMIAFHLLDLSYVNPPTNKNRNVQQGNE